VEPLILVVLPAVAGILGFVWLDRGRRRERMLRAARECGLVLVEDPRSFRLYRDLSFNLGGNAGVSLIYSDLKRGVVLTVKGLPRLRLAQLDQETLGTRLMGADDTVGHPEFDRALRVRGMRSAALAALDQRTRALVLSLFDLPGTVAFDEDGFEVCFRRWPSQRLPAVVKQIVAAAAHLADPVDVEEALARNARQDPQPAVRAANVRALAADFAGTPATREVLRAACADRDEEVALAAALELGPDGHDTLRRLAGEAEGDATAAAAIAALGTALPADRLLELFRSARRARRPRKVVACIAALGGHPGAAAVPGLEPLLIEALAGEEEGVPVAAARALGAMGTAAAVSALRLAEEKGGALAAAAGDAIGAIHSRLQGAAPGQVSLAGGESGQVSLADDAAGRLSVKAED
jgi:hypothetical protein